MRPAPPLQVTVARFGTWRAVIGLLVAVVAATMTAWLVSLHDDAALAAWPVRVGMGIAVLVASVAALTLAAPPAFSLRWDGRHWHLGPVASIGNEPETGAVRVTMDLGAWMLLRFDAERSVRRPRSRWLPVQRSSAPQAWHALRCAVYSPRLENGDSPLDSSVSASTRPPFPG